MNEVLDVSKDRAEVMFAGEENKYILMFDLKIEILCTLDISNAEGISHVWRAANTTDRYSCDTLRINFACSHILRICELWGRVGMWQIFIPAMPFRRKQT